MTQEAKTIRSLLSNPDTAMFGFDLAKEVFADRHVRAELIGWYQAAKHDAANVHAGILPTVFKVKYLLPRVERFLQLMESIDDDGNRIEDSGDADALGGHCGSWPGYAAKHQPYITGNRRYPGTSTV